MTFIGRSLKGPYFLSEDDRARHINIIGQTGAGKTTLLKQMIADDLAAGRGLCVLDPHGDLAEDVLTLVPSSRTDDVLYLDVSEPDWPVGFNIFDGIADDPILKDTAASHIVAPFKHIWGLTYEDTPSLLDYLNNGVRALLDTPGSTLLGLGMLYTDEDYRRSVVARVKNPIVRRYFLKELPKADKRELEKTLRPLYTRSRAFTAATALRNIIGQPKSSLKIRQRMDQQRILIVNLSKGKIGDGNAYLFGSLIVTGIMTATLSRADVPEDQRPPFYLYADEFQNFATESFSTILSEARKYGLSLTLAHQYLGQLPEALRLAVLGNVGSLIAFRLGAEDAPLIASHIGAEVDPQELKDLSNFRAVGRFLHAGAPTNPVRLTMDPAPAPVRPDGGEIKSRSRSKFGRKRSRVEDRIERFLGLRALP